MKRTPWFPGDVAPVRKGVYERDYGPTDGILYSHWSGRKWGYWGSTPYRAYANGKGDFESVFQCMPWRGLTEKQA
jgi:hypothetical protein